ncbi:MAG: DUF29 domain-containing protein [Methylocystis sp.]
MAASRLYDQDFYAWANEQAALLRAGRLGEADIEHIAEEIESLGKTEKRELVSRLRALMLHLLKWRFEPGKRTRSWEATIKIQRLDLLEHLQDNPSLRPEIVMIIEKAFKGAVLEAIAETGFSDKTFPEKCPWTFDEMTAEDFWPEG